MWLNLFVAGCMGCLPILQAAAPGKPVESNREVTLTEAQPVARTQLSASAREAPPSILEVPVIKIWTPQKMSFSIFVYLERLPSVPASTAKQRVLLGNFTVFPPDQTGSYMLRSSSGFQKLKATSADLGQGQIVVVVEMKRTNPKQPWSPVRVTIGPLRWRSEKP